MGWDIVPIASRPWFDLAGPGREGAGVDLWNYHNKEGAGIRTAFDLAVAHAAGEKKWAYQQISPYNTGDLYAMLLQVKFPKYKKDPRYSMA